MANTSTPTPTPSTPGSRHIVTLQWPSYGLGHTGSPSQGNIVGRLLGMTCIGWALQSSLPQDSVGEHSSGVRWPTRTSRSMQLRIPLTAGHDPDSHVGFRCPAPLRLSRGQASCSGAGRPRRAESCICFLGVGMICLGVWRLLTNADVALLGGPGFHLEQVRQQSVCPRLTAQHV